MSGKNTTNKLKESEKKYRQLVEDANSIILRMDVKGNVTFFNRFARKFFGYKDSEILGRSVIGTIVPETDSAGSDLRLMIRDLLRNPGRYSNNENENMMHSGERVWISWTNRAVSGKTSRGKEILCVGNDISEVKKAQEMLKEMDKRKSAFVANVSHEFKNPLGTLREVMGAVLGGSVGEINPKQRQVVEIGKRSVERLIRLVTDLLDVAKIEAGKMKLKSERIDMRSLTEEAIEANKAAIMEKKLTVRKNMPSGLGIIRADRDKITEVIINLLSNAIKYTPSGGIITITIAGIKNGIRFTMTDNGPGIAEENINKLFDKFERITAERQEGTGLGLCIAKDIVGLHRGKMWVESELGKGSSFIFTLPVDCRKNAKAREKMEVGA